MERVGCPPTSCDQPGAAGPCRGRWGRGPQAPARRDPGDQAPRRLPDAGTERTWEQRTMEACLWGGPGAAASFSAAAALLRLDGFERQSIEISVRKSRRLKDDPTDPKPRLRVHRSEAPEQEVTRIEGIPVANAHRTLRDLLPLLEPERAEQVLDDALRK